MKTASPYANSLPYVTNPGMSAQPAPGPLTGPLTVAVVQATALAEDAGVLVARFEGVMGALLGETTGAAPEKQPPGVVGHINTLNEKLDAVSRSLSVLRGIAARLESL